MTHYLLFDISNALYRTFFSPINKQYDDETVAGLATHAALTTLNSYFKKYKPDKVVMALDRRSWRKDYTASDACVSKKPYKGNRRQNMTPAEEAKYERFIAHVREFETLIMEHTSITVLVKEQLEADDLIAGFCQKYKDDPTVKITLISTDTDYLQLLKYPNLTIVAPQSNGKDKVQELSEFDGDPEYFLFSKCVRGDSTDNVQSAYPRVRQTKIKAAYEDEYTRVQMMKETWTDQNGRELMVEDVYKENRLLIDLEAQPANIRQMITEGIEEAETRGNKFSYFHFLKFTGKYKLKTIRENIDNFMKLLNK